MLLFEELLSARFTFIFFFFYAAPSVVCQIFDFF